MCTHNHYQHTLAIRKNICSNITKYVYTQSLSTYISYEKEHMY